MPALHLMRNHLYENSSREEFYANVCVSRNQKSWELLGKRAVVMVEVTPGYQEIRAGARLRWPSSGDYSPPYKLDQISEISPARVVIEHSH